MNRRVGTRAHDAACSGRGRDRRTDGWGDPPLHCSAPFPQPIHLHPFCQPAAVHVVSSDLCGSIRASPPSRVCILWHTDDVVMWPLFSRISQTFLKRQGYSADTKNAVFLLLLLSKCGDSSRGRAAAGASRTRQSSFARFIHGFATAVRVRPPARCRSHL